MNYRFVLYSVGKLLQVLGLVLFIPTAIAFYEIGLKTAKLGDPRILGFVIAIGSSLACGTIIALLCRTRTQGGVREGFAIVTLGWLLFTLFGCIPLLVLLIARLNAFSLHAYVCCFTDAFFEIMSGFTTTGATILTDIEVLPKGILFWRSMTHWLGGMGIVTLALVVFPAFGVAAYQMFRGEVPGPSAERLAPRIGRTAMILWGVYVLLTLAETLLLWIGGMTLLESFCHAFGTMATGGFSTRNASIGAFNSDFIDWVVIVFMFFAGMNFIIHYRALFGFDFKLIRKNSEFHFYVAVIAIAIVTGVFFLYFLGPNSPADINRSFRSQPLSEKAIEDKIELENQHCRNLYQTARYVSFQVVSITTTTGYCTADFDVWPTIIRFGLVLLMFFGGCAGSTGGGIKMIRVMVGLKAAWREVRTMIQPRLVMPIKIDGEWVEDKRVLNILGFFALFLLLFVILTAFMAMMVPDFTTAITSVVATMCNIGPGLSGIGATENYAWVPPVGKWVLILCMLLGRLEIYTVLIAFAPISWRR